MNLLLFIQSLDTQPLSLTPNLSCNPKGLPPTGLIMPIPTQNPPISAGFDPDVIARFGTKLRNLRKSQVEGRCRWNLDVSPPGSDEFFDIDFSSSQIIDNYQFRRRLVRYFFPAMALPPKIQSHAWCAVMNRLLKEVQ